MPILAIDLGGTHARFGMFAAQANTQVETPTPLWPIFKFSSQLPSIRSWADLLLHYEKHKPTNYEALERYDAIVLAAPGPVVDKHCTLPNLPWDIHLSDGPHEDKVLMINDFVAQAYGIVHPSTQPQLKLLRAGKTNVQGNIAVVGAGSGLGHCCLMPHAADDNNLIHLPSEAGHTVFAFTGKQEKHLETFIATHTGQSPCFTDTLLSGRGLAFVHAFLTNTEPLAPNDINSDNPAFANSIAWLAHFYGRACRNYCLSTLATGGLLITGGVVKHHPQVVTHPAFYAEFINASPYQSLLQNISIYYNTGIETGLLGAAFYGQRQLALANR